MGKTINQIEPTRHYVDDAGRYLGGFGGGAVPPRGAVEVPTAPNDAAQVWTGSAWGPEPDYSARKTRLDRTVTLLVDKGVLTQAEADSLETAPLAHPVRVG